MSVTGESEGTSFTGLGRPQTPKNAVEVRRNCSPRDEVAGLCSCGKWLGTPCSSKQLTTRERERDGHTGSTMSYLQILCFGWSLSRTRNRGKLVRLPLIWMRHAGFVRLVLTREQQCPCAKNKGVDLVPCIYAVIYCNIYN